MSYRKLHIRKLSGALSEADTVLGPWCLSDDDQKGADRLINSYHDPWDDADLVCQETEKLRKIVDDLVQQYSTLLMNKHGLVDHDIFFGKLLVNWLGPIVAMTHERRLQLEHFISFSSPGEYQANGLKVNQIELMTTGCSSAIFHQDEISEFITTQLLEKLNPECIHLSQIKVIDNVRSNFALALLDQSNLSKLKRFLHWLVHKSTLSSLAI